MINLVLVTYAAIVVISLISYCAALGDNYNGGKIEKVVIAGCVFWFIPLIVYLLCGVIDLVKWSCNTIGEHL